MIPAQFKKLLVTLEHLTDKQVKDVENFLKGDNLIQPIIAELEQRMIDEPECPHCNSCLINRHGKVGAMQRFRCKNCTKTFNAVTKTPLARLQHKEKWLDYLQCMINGKVLRESATDCDINLKISFRWRHRFLQLPATMKATLLGGIIEADETLFARSEKGNRTLERKPRKRGVKAKNRGRSKEDWVPVLTVRDRGKNTYEVIIPSVSTEQFNKELQGKIIKDSVLCTDGFRSYIKFAQSNDLIHKRLNVAAGLQVIEKVFHIQNVNAYHSRLKAWMDRFHGVATKYLENYLGWFRFLDTNENPNKNNLFGAQQHLAGT
jgi:transposase-like protein